MKHIFLIFALVLLSACATFVAEKTDDTKKYAPTTPESVQVLTQEPKEPYIVIGEILAEGETLSRSDSIEQNLKSKAAQMGAEAIILKIQKRKPGMINGNMVEGNSYVYDYNEIFAKKMKAQAIRFKK